MQVRVKKLGYYEHKRRKEGEILSLNSEKEFSAAWMERLEDESHDEAEGGHAHPHAKKRGKGGKHSHKAKDEPAFDEEVI